MKKGILGRKLGMTQVFGENGIMIPVTVVEAGPCIVVQKKTVEKEGYAAIQLGFAVIKPKSLNKPAKGHFAKNSLTPKKYLREFRLENCDSFELGQELKADVFAVGDKVDVSGISKGKGFQGPIKRHNQTRGPMSHGSKYHRGPGSMGSGTSPGKVRKGKKLAGHMGHEKITIQNLTIVRTDAEKNLILIKGAVPGPKGTLLVVKDTVKQ